MKKPVITEYKEEDYIEIAPKGSPFKCIVSYLYRVIRRDGSPIYRTNHLDDAKRFFAELSYGWKIQDEIEAERNIKQETTEENQNNEGAIMNSAGYDFLEKDQNWQNQSTTYWFLNQYGEPYGLVDRNGELTLVDYEGHPIHPDSDKDGVKTALEGLYKAHIHD